MLNEQIGLAPFFSGCLVELNIGCRVTDTEKEVKDFGKVQERHKELTVTGSNDVDEAITVSLSNNKLIFLQNYNYEGVLNDLNESNTQGIQRKQDETKEPYNIVCKIF